MGRWWVPLMGLLTGSYSDSLEITRRCNMAHPPPKWVIERATPIDDALKQKEKYIQALKAAPHRVMLPEDQAAIAAELKKDNAKRQ